MDSLKRKVKFYVGFQKEGEILWTVQKGRWNSTENHKDVQFYGVSQTQFYVESQQELAKKHLHYTSKQRHLLRYKLGTEGNAENSRWDKIYRLPYQWLNNNVENMNSP